MNIKMFAVLPAVALLAACGTSDPYGKRAEFIQQQNVKAVENSIDQLPEWMTKLPISNSAVYSNGSGISNDLSMADHKAQADAYGKICMAAGGTASQKTKIYRMDSEAASTELSEMALRSACKEVDLTGVEVKDLKRVAENGRFRTYVLIALPTGDANLLRKARDAQRVREIAAERAPNALRELDHTGEPPAPKATLRERPLSEEMNEEDAPPKPQAAPRTRVERSM
jgi:hypothetical protein